MTQSPPSDVIAEFIVDGIPAPQGSKQIRQNKARTKAWLTESSKALKPWREQVKIEAERAMEAGSSTAYPGATIDYVRPPYGDAVHVALTFVFVRPRSVKPAQRPHHTVKPDLDKLTRAILDALTGTVLVDDSRVVSIQAHKRYQEASFDKPGVIVRVVKFRG